MIRTCLRSSWIAFVWIIFFMVNASALLAHDLWIEPATYQSSPGKEVTMTLGYGHQFPATDFLADEYLDEAYMLGPDGKRIDIAGTADTAYKPLHPPAENGAYIAVVTMNGRYWTKTTQGYQGGKSKVDVKNAISCTHSLKYSKSIINLGSGPDHHLSNWLGHDLEILPLGNPARLKKGDSVPIQVLFHGKPLPKAQVFATYAGFSDKSHTYAYSTQTDSEGKADIQAHSSGAWLVKVNHRDEYPNPEKCDEYSFTATLTFEIQ